MKHAQKHWAKHHRNFDERVVVVHQHVHAGPAVIERQVFVPAAPAPGVHVVMPSMLVPF